MDLNASQRPLADAFGDPGPWLAARWTQRMKPACGKGLPGAEERVQVIGTDLRSLPRPSASVSWPEVPGAVLHVLDAAGWREGPPDWCRSALRTAALLETASPLLESLAPLLGPACGPCRVSWKPQRAAPVLGLWLSARLGHASAEAVLAFADAASAARFAQRLATAAGASEAPDEDTEDADADADAASSVHDGFRAVARLGDAAAPDRLALRSLLGLVDLEEADFAALEPGAGLVVRPAWDGDRRWLVAPAGAEWLALAELERATDEPGCAWRVAATPWAADDLQACVPVLPVLPGGTRQRRLAVHGRGWSASAAGLAALQADSLLPDEGEELVLSLGTRPVGLGRLVSADAADLGGEWLLQVKEWPCP